VKYWIAILLTLCTACGRAPRVVDASGAPQAAAGRVVLGAGSPQLHQIRTAPVAAVEVPLDPVVAPGKVQFNPNRISKVSLPVAGRIAAVEVRLGDSVTQGQPLARVESPEIETAQSDCMRADAVEMQARAGVNKARADLARQRDLLEHGAVPRKDVLDAEAETARAEGALKEAGAAVQQSRRRLAILGLKPCEYGQQVVVRAPISGKIMEIAAVPGEYRTDTSAPLMTIADLSTVWVASDVPESSIRLIHPGERVEIELAAYPGETFRGLVMRVADTVDPVTRSVEVRTELDNRAGRFRPEMFARIRHAHGSQRLPAVPSSAVVQASGRAWVFVERSAGEFERRAVEIGETFGPSIPVLAGVQPGDRVVVEGAVLLQALSGGAR